MKDEKIGSGFEDNTLQTPPSKDKNKADIVFCIDFSGSMTGVIEGVKKYIVDFVDKIKTDPENPMDVRVGFIGQYYGKFFIKDFTEDPKDFASALNPLDTGGDEFTLPALDWALDFPWRHGVHKIVVLFTDECLDTGHDPSRQRSKMEELIEKVNALHAKVFAYGPDCEEYKKFFESLPKSHYTEVEFSAISPDEMSPVLDQIAKTVTQTSRGEAAQTPPGSIKKDLYGIGEEKGFEIMRL